MKGISKGNKLTNYLWIATIISMIVILLGLSYYFQSVQKGRYFDQLYFRQLEEISRGFETNLVRLRSFSRVTQNFIYDTFDKALQDNPQNIVKAVYNPGSSGNGNAAGQHRVADGTDRDFPLSPFQPFFDSRQNLAYYVSDLTKADLVHEASEKEQKHYAELESDIESLIDEELEFILTCSISADPSIFDSEMFEVYCDSLRTIVSVLRELPDYAETDLEQLDDTKLSKVAASLADLATIQSKAKPIAIVDPEENDIKKRRDIIQLLNNLTDGEDDTTETISSYKDYRSEYQSLKADINSVELRQLLEQHYQNEDCQQPCRAKPDISLSDLYAAEIRHQLSQKAQLLADYILKRFILLISEYIPALTKDLNNFYNSAKNALDTFPHVQTTESNGSEMQAIRRAEYTDHKQRYLALQGPLEASVNRHGLGLEYVKKKCDKKIEDRIQRENCEGILFVGASEKTNPYPVSNLVVTSFLPDGYAFTTPMENLLPGEIGDFSAALITTEDGDVIIQNDSFLNIGNQHFLGINDLLERAISASNLGDSNDNCSKGDANCSKRRYHDRLEHSSYVDEVIGGTAYRLYIRPHTIGQIKMYFENKPRPHNTLYFVGIKPLQELRANKFRISPGASIVMFFIVTAITLAFVFLKIRLAHVDASFTRNDGLITVFAVILFVILSTIGIATLAQWDKLNSELESDAYKSIRYIQERFTNELRSYINFFDYLMLNKDVVDSLDKPEYETANTGFRNAGAADAKKAVANILPNDALMPEIFARLQDLDFTDELLSYEPITEIKVGFKSYEYGSVPYFANGKNRPLESGVLSQNAVSPIENIFMLDNNGHMTGELIRGTKNLVSFRLRDLGARKYFIRANEGDVWEIRLKCTYDMSLAWCPPKQDDEAIAPVFMERIFNIIDGARNTQFSIPVRHQNNRYKTAGNDAEIFNARELYDLNTDKPTVISFGVSMHTFKAPILPSGLQFAVIDNNSGAVIYHSDDNRSLIENFLQETENDPQLASIIRVSQGARSNDCDVDFEPDCDVDGHIETFSGVYRGTDTVFFATKLHKDIPWTLIVFKGIEEEQLLVTLLFSISIVIALAILFFTAVILLLVSLRYPRIFHWLWPQLSKSNTYNKIAISCIILAVPIYLLLLVPDDLLSIFLLVSFVVVSIVTAISLSISLSVPVGSSVTPDLSKHRRRYIGLMLSVLLITSFIPSLVIVEKVSGELLHRAGMYYTIKLNEQKTHAQSIIDARLDRLCGEMARERRDYRNCDSIQNILLHDLRKYIHTLGVAQCDDHNSRTFCLTNTPGISELKHEKMDINLLLTWLDTIWDLPALLVTLENADDLTLSLNGGLPYRVMHAHPHYGNLLLEKIWIVLLVPLTWLIAAVAVRFVAIYLLGINVPRSYRTAHCALDSSNWDDFVRGRLRPQLLSDISYDQLYDTLTKKIPHYAIMIRPIARNMKAFLKRIEKRKRSAGPAYLAVDLLQYCCTKSYRKSILRRLRTDDDKNILLVLENIESVAFDKEKRMIFLEFIESQLADKRSRSTLILCDVAPLYMLTQQSEYLPNSMRNEFADSQEVVRWSRLLFQFSKYYDWNPMEIDLADDDPWENLVIRELSVWPELYPLKPGLDVLKKEKKSKECAIQYIATHAGSIYRRRWSFCTKNEKLLLYQLAKGLMINPQNIEPLEHLMRRGFIRRDPNWSIVSQSFARFVMTAENESVYNEWVTASEQGLWKILRIPLFTAVIVIVGILMYSAQEATESFLALATSVLALLPLLLRNLNLTMTAPYSDSEN